jgi:anti-anti-sigma regulatory factor
MSRNFKIETHHGRGSVHLRLAGDFDGSSACELLRTLETHTETARCVFVHTDALKTVNDFGRAVFQKGFVSTTRGSAEIVLEGDKLTP